MADTDPKNMGEWIEQASEEERFQFLKERLEAAQVEIGKLQNIIKTQAENHKNLVNLFKSHTHDKTGNTVLPAGFMNIQ